MPDFTISDSDSVIGSFASRPAPKLVFGHGALRELAACVREVGGTSVFLVTDPGLARAGYVERARALLAARGASRLLLSLTHTDTLAQAFVVLVR